MIADACNCTGTGYAGAHCGICLPHNLCCGNEQQLCHNGGSCLFDPAATGHGFTCDCSGSGFTGSFCDQHADGSAAAGPWEDWEVFCAVVTAASLLTVPCVIVLFRATLANLEDMQLPQGKDSLGWWGLLFFVVGVLDLFSDCGLCITLFMCEEWHLLICSATTIVVTTAVTLYLGFSTLTTIRTDDPDSRASSWLMSGQNGIVTSVIIIASASRLESMAILRLRLCGWDVLDFPMGDKYFHFVRHAGVYHHIIEDIPHAMVSLALISFSGQDREDGQPHCGDESSVLGVTGHTLAITSLVFSLGSIFFGLVNKAVMLIAMPERTEVMNSFRRSVGDLRQSIPLAVMGGGSARVSDRQRRLVEQPGSE